MRNKSWHYREIDNFLESEDFQFLLRKALPVVKSISGQSADIKVHKSNSKGLESEILSADEAKKIADKYETKLRDILFELEPKKVNLYDHIQIQISLTGPNASYPVHEDHPKKILSGVIYLHPEISTGTFLHASEESAPFKEIQWKPNRAFFFSRESGRTWHSYKGDGIETRVTCIMNLMTSRPDEHLRFELGYVRFIFSKMMQKISKILG